MVDIIIDEPGLYASEEEWRSFLAEMKKAKRKANNIDTAMYIDRMIKRAEQALANRP